MKTVPTNVQVVARNSSGAIGVSYAYESYGNTAGISGTSAADDPYRFASGYFDGSSQSSSSAPPSGRTVVREDSAVRR